MKNFDLHGLPASFEASLFYFLVQPETGDTYPPKAIWGLATGFHSYDFNAQEAKRWLEKLGFYVHDIRLEPTPQTLNEKVRQSLCEAREARQARLASASKSPRSALVLVRRFHRNPDVIAERLDIAQGVCENCHQPAPFRKKKDGAPFLEVHHVVSLADGGEDSVENTRSLCPNCHREAHWG